MKRTPLSIAADGEPLTRHPKRKGRPGAKFQMSMTLPVPVGSALRRIAREEERSLSDLICEACTYWLDINRPNWEEQENA